MSEAASSKTPVRAGIHAQRWQRTVLPIMAVLLVGATCFFLYVSMSQLSVVFERIQAAPRLDMTKDLAELEKSFSRQDIEYARWKSLVLLESYALSQRHDKGGALILTRVWLKYLGFLTGMILSLIGASVVLGKLRDKGSSLQGESGAQLRIALNTTSPGIFLVTVGAMLMMTTMLAHQQIEVNDAPIFVSTWQRPDAHPIPSAAEARTAEALGGLPARKPEGSAVFEPEPSMEAAKPLPSTAPLAKPPGPK